MWHQRWHDGHPLFALLLPLSLLFGLITALRRQLYRAGLLRAWRAPVPVIVIGNITVGGTGKTPVTLAVVEQLRQAGWRPAIVSRGYGGDADYPCRVLPDSPAAEVGDEPLLLARRSGVPVVVDPLRARAVRHVLAETDSNVIVCDDGLQHYALARDVEIVVIDGQRGLGSGWLLPAGPLREGMSRLASADAIVINGTWSRPEPVPAHAHVMSLLPGSWQPLAADTPQQPPQPPATVHAMAGIGHPPRFFAQLRQAGFTVIEHPFPDHHAYTVDELHFTPPAPLVMTEKDAVKCRGLVPADSWMVPVQAMLPPLFWQTLMTRLAAWRPPHA